MRVECNLCGDLIDDRQLKSHQAGLPCSIRERYGNAIRAGYQRVPSCWIQSVKKALPGQFWIRLPYRLFQSNLVYTVLVRPPRTDVTLDEMFLATRHRALETNQPLHCALREVLLLSAPRIRAMALGMRVLSQKSQPTNAMPAGPVQEVNQSV
jgi:hypothetical protein